MIVVLVLVLVVAKATRHLLETLGVLFVVWVFRLIAVPYTGCMWCGGSGRNPFSGKRRHGDCWFCHGARRRRVLGAKTAHKAWQSFRGRQR
jgi:hypothetical protein